MHDTQRRGRRPRLDANFGLVDGSKSAFRSDHQFRKIELPVPDELVEVVAADAPLDLRVPAIDLFAVAVDDVGDASLDAPAVNRILEAQLSKRPCLARCQ